MIVQASRWFLLLAVLLCSLSEASGQKRPKLVVLPPKDLTGASKELNLGDKIQSKLINALIKTGKFQVLERSQLDAIAAERNLKLDADFDPRNAPKSGLQKVCDYVLAGNIEAFSASQQAQGKSGVFSKDTQVEGRVKLSVSYKLVSAETGEALLSEDGKSEPHALISTIHNNSMLSTFVKINGQAAPSSSNTSATGTTLVSIVDDGIADVASQIGEKVAANPINSQPKIYPMVAGVQNGLVFLNKGENANVEVGHTYEIVRSMPGMVDPETGERMVVHTKICTLTISSVEETSSQGKCAGGVPIAKDEAREVH